MRQLLLFIFFFLFVQWINGQHIGHESIQQNITQQLVVFPQEKLYLQTDRDYYVPGENIWFKAYLVDAFTHQYPVKSRYVYVELISSVDTLVSRVMIRPDTNHIHYGHIFLSRIIPEGDYTLRAYTRYMQNMGDEYFFKKNIHIGNLVSDAEGSDNKKKSKKAMPPKDDYDVSFFPEGGNLPEGIPCRIAFKALTNKGYSESISGEILDEEGTLKTTVETIHAGMGIFAFIPEEGKTYYLDCSNGNGLKKRFQLPPAVSDTPSLNIYLQDKNLLITQLKPAKMTHNPKRYLLVHSKGQVHYFDAWDYTHSYVAISGEQLPAGVIQIILFDGHLNPLSERLVFNTTIDLETAQLEFRTDKEAYETRDHVSSRLKITDTDGTPLPGNLSIAITDDKDVVVDDESILTTLLLTSELKGNIESPGYYFRDTTRRRKLELDLLMMTHGWRRYNIPEVAKGNYQRPEIPFEESQQLSGVVKSLVLSKPIANSEVTVLTSNQYILQTEADKQGRFLFAGYEHPDSTTYYVQSLGKKGSNRVELILDEEAMPAFKYLPQPPVLLAQSVENDTLVSVPENAFMEKAEQRAKYDADMRIVHLTNVEVVAPYIKKDIIDIPWYSSGSDATIDRNKIEKRHSLYVTDMLQSVAGVYVMGNGGISIRGGGLPLVLIDGMPTDWPDFMDKTTSPVESVNINDVERIDVFKGASTSMFGTRGANGVISIVTRRGGYEPSHNEMFNQTVITPLGYQKPAEFYSPKYDTPELRYTGQPDYRTTIFWKPDIITDDNGEASFDFYTSDFPTTYSVVIEGITMDGKIVYKRERLMINH